MTIIKLMLAPVYFIMTGTVTAPFGKARQSSRQS